MMMSKNKHALVEALGWYGVVAILGAYALLSFGMLSADDPVYQLLNLSGAVAIIADAWVDRNYQPVVLNLIWFLIALSALVRSFL